MKYMLMLLLLGPSIQSPGQTTDDKPVSIKPNVPEVEFIKWFFSNRKPEDDGNYYYSSNIGWSDYTRRLLSNDTIKYLYSYGVDGKAKTNKDLVILNAEEKQFVKAQLDSVGKVKWKKGSIFKNRHIRLRKTTQSSYSIGRPIFLRDNTICIFEYSYYCGSRCADGSTAIYRKVNEKWQTWMVLTRWES